jgi:hypothetical protein
MRRALPALLACAVLAGCGGASHNTTSTTKESPTTATPTTTTAQLEQAVRTALQQNAKVSDYVLEHNTIPAWARQSTDGPALSGMRGSAAQRHSGHITVHVLSDVVQVETINLAPSYATATADVTERSRVVPLRNGHRLGKAVVGNEHARFTLHRANGTTFVVWSIGRA